MVGRAAEIMPPAGGNVGKKMSSEPRRPIFAPDAAGAISLEKEGGQQADKLNSPLKVLQRVFLAAGVNAKALAELDSSYQSVRNSATLFAESLYCKDTAVERIVAYDAMEAAVSALHRKVFGLCSNLVKSDPKLDTWRAILDRHDSKDPLVNLREHINSLMEFGFAESKSTVSAEHNRPASDAGMRSGAESNVRLAVELIGRARGEYKDAPVAEPESTEGTLDMIFDMTTKFLEGLQKLGENVHARRVYNISVVLLGITGAVVSTLVDGEVVASTESWHDLIESALSVDGGGGTSGTPDSATSPTPTPVPAAAAAAVVPGQALDRRPRLPMNRIDTDNVIIEQASLLAMLSDPGEVDGLKRLDQEDVELISTKASTPDVLTGEQLHMIHTIDTKITGQVDPETEEKRARLISRSLQIAGASQSNPLVDRVVNLMKAGKFASREARRCSPIVNFMTRQLHYLLGIAEKTWAWITALKDKAVTTHAVVVQRVKSVAAAIGRSRAFEVGVEICRFIGPFVPSILHVATTAIDVGLSPDSAALELLSTHLPDVATEHLGTAIAGAVANIEQASAERRRMLSRLQSDIDSVLRDGASEETMTLPREEMAELETGSDSHSTLVSAYGFSAHGWAAMAQRPEELEPARGVPTTIGSSTRWIGRSVVKMEAAIRGIRERGIEQTLEQRLVRPLMLIVHAGCRHKVIGEALTVAKFVFVNGVKVALTALAVTAIINAFTPYGPALIAAAAILCIAFVAIRHGPSIVRAFKFIGSKILNYLKVRRQEHARAQAFALNRVHPLEDESDVFSLENVAEIAIAGAVAGPNLGAFTRQFTRL